MLTTLMLLPYKENCLLKSRDAKLNILYLLSGLTEEAKEAITHFQNKNYQNFDAQVGETLCQIRAYKIAVLSKNLIFNQELTLLLEKLEKYSLSIKLYQDNFESLVASSYKYNSLLDSKETLYNFMQQNHLLEFFHQDQFFIILSYFLAKYCITDVYFFPCGINYNKIREKFKVGISSARNIANHYQTVLAQLSCDFIISCAENDVIDNTYFLTNIIRTGDKNRKALPYYEVVKVLLESRMTKIIPIIIIINRFNHSHIGNQLIDKYPLKFIFDEKSNNFVQLSSNLLFNSEDPCIVFNCVSFNESGLPFTEYLKQVFNIGIKKIILLNAASHPQYAGILLSKYSATPFKDICFDNVYQQVIDAKMEEFLFARKESIKYGCSKSNPIFIHIQHIYCSNLAKYMDLNLENNWQMEREENQLQTKRSSFNLEDLDFIDIFLKLAPGHIYWKDLDGRFQGCNELQAIDAGFTGPKDIIGKTDFDMPWKEDAQFLRSVDAQVIKSQETMVIEEKSKTADGREAIWLSRKSPLKNKKGETVGIIGISIDITDRKDNERLAMENRFHKVRYEEQEKFKKDVDQVIHDIRSPLTSLEMLAKFCKSLDESDRNAFRDIATSITDIANNLLNKYKLGLQEYTDDHNISHEDARQPVLISMILSHVLSEKKYQYKQSKVNFELHIAQDEYFAFINIQPVSLRRALSNIINNAVDACDGKNSVIKVYLEQVAESVKITITDNGKGMPCEIIDKIMNGTAVTSGKVDGHGIGMEQVRGMLERNKGVLTIDSIIDQGTSVSLNFAKVPKAEWIIDKINIKSDDLLIVVDDDESIHKAWDTRVEAIKHDYPNIKILHFKFGVEALKFIHKLSVADKQKIVLLTDYELLNQDIDGLDIIRQAQVERAVLVTSHYNNSDIRDRLAAIGTKLLPKQLATEVLFVIDGVKFPDDYVSVEKTENQEEHLLRAVDLVIVDDEKIFVDTMIRYLMKDMQVDAYYYPEELLDNFSKYPKNTKFAIDNNYKNSSLTGMDVARTLYNQGFTNLYILSGNDPENIDCQGIAKAILKDVSTDEIEKYLVKK